MAYLADESWLEADLRRSSTAWSGVLGVAGAQVLPVGGRLRRVDRIGPGLELQVTPRDEVLRVGRHILSVLVDLHERGLAHGAVSPHTLGRDLQLAPPVPWALPGDRGRRQDLRSLALLMSSLVLGQRCSSVRSAQRVLGNQDPLSDLLGQLSSWAGSSRSALEALRDVGEPCPTRVTHNLDRAVLLLTLLGAEVVYLSEAGLVVF